MAKKIMAMPKMNPFMAMIAAKKPKIGAKKMVATGKKPKKC
jgi:hypothetical protein